MTETREQYTVVQMRLEEGIGLAQRIIAELEQHPGAECVINGKALAAKLSQNYGVVRNCIRDIRTRREFPIGSNRFGYFKAIRPEELEQTRDMIDHLARAAHGVCGALKRTEQARFSGQAQIPVAGDGDESDT
jgi:hypothetical protein